MYYAEMETEVGRVEFDIPETIAVYMTPKEYLRSLRLEEFVLAHCTCYSYRKSEQLINRALNREPGEKIKVSTLNDHVEALGEKASEYLADKTEEIIQEAFPGYEGDLTEESIQKQLAQTYPEPSQPEDATRNSQSFACQIEAFNAGKDTCDQIKREDLVDATETCPEKTVYISVDDVGVGRQKEKRSKDYKKDRKRVENTVIHVESSGRKHIITAVGMKKAFAMLIAFLISNDLLIDRHIVFFSDGAQNIRSCIEAFFSFRKPVVHMLDWYHLEKRMKEMLSMAVKGSKETKLEIRNTLNRRLWAGNVDEAIQYLRVLPGKSIKNQQRLDEAVDYLERRKPHIACYALRSILDYRNSSNPAEKANDRIVATRQKHNGMSWSSGGSSALAVITVLEINGELSSWISKGTIPFNINSAGSNKNKAA